MWNGIKNFFRASRAARSPRAASTSCSRTIAPASRAARLQEMRAEIAAVIAKYVPIDAEAVEIQIETRSRETQLTVSSAIQPRNV